MSIPPKNAKILNATWLTPSALIELKGLEKSDPDSFGMIAYQYENWNAIGQPDILFIGNVCRGGAKETFLALQKKFNIGVEGQGTTPSTNHYVGTPLSDAVSGISMFKKRTLPLIDELLAQGANPNILLKKSFGYSPMHNAVKHAPTLSLLIAAGGDVNIGSSSDPNLANQKPYHLLSDWVDQAHGNIKEARKYSMPVLQILFDNGANFNHEIDGVSEKSPGPNFLCAVWITYGLSVLLPDILKMGLDPYEIGPDGESLHSLVFSQSIKGPMNKRLKAQSMVDFLETNYPAKKSKMSV